MTEAQAAVQAMHNDYIAAVAEVRAQYDALPLASMQLLIARTKARHAEDAIREEARQRVRRNKWAAVTSKSA